MKHLASAFLLLVLCICVLTPGPARTQWVEDGVEVLDHWLSISDIRIVGDGEGGAIAVWTDYRGGTPNIYGQKIDVYGNPVWTANGVSVCSDPAYQATSQLVSDGAGGAIIIWQDERNGNTDIYAQRISSGGAALWTADGISVCSASGQQAAADISEDGYGGALIAWEDQRGGESRVYAQRIDGSGNALWSANGVGASTDDSLQIRPQIVSDCEGGAIVCWVDYRNISTGPDIYALRLHSSNGSVLWGSDAAVCTATGSQFNVEAVSDRSCGVIMTWEDSRAGWDIYTQRLDNYGIAQWTTDGVTVCSASGSQTEPQIVADEAGGAIITWEDMRNGNLDIYAQAVDLGGSVQWTTDGVAICTASGTQNDPMLVTDMNDGAIITWYDKRFSYSDIYVQRIDVGGTVQWTADGVALCEANGNQENPEIVTDGDFGAIVAWPDHRDLDSDIYAQRIERNGYWGYPAPQISSIRDVPGDEGGLVNLAWDASRLDIWPEDHISHYTIWRAISEEAVALMLGKGAVLVEGIPGFLSFRGEMCKRDGSLDAVSIKSVNNPSAEIVDAAPSGSSGGVQAQSPVIIRREMLAGDSYHWTYITTVNSSYYVDEYAETVPTLFDSTASSDEYHYFQVIAHESDPTGFWISAPDSGYSVDNLAPCMPLCLAGEQSYQPEGLELTWAPNSEPDLDCYHIYRGIDPGFTPGPGNLIAQLCDTLLFDDEWRWDSGYCYKAAAVDVHGNESGYALLCSDGVTGDETPTAPHASYLAQNHPNPFNPSTTIAFGLANPGPVRLRIYDAGGRLVRTLIEDNREAGVYREVWDGRDDRGRTVSSGIYFYRLTAGAYAETKKMVLLR